MAVVPTPGVRVTVAEALIRDLGSVAEWCDLSGMKLNASKTKTMIVSRLLTMNPLSLPLTIGGTVLKESDDLIILGVTFDSKMTFEKHLRSVSRAASQRLGILRMHWRCSVIDRFLGDALGVLSCPFCSTLDRAVIGARFLTGVCLCVTLLIVNLLQSCVRCIKSGVTLCTRMLVLYPVKNYRRGIADFFGVILLKRRRSVHFIGFKCSLYHCIPVINQFYLIK